MKLSILKDTPPWQWPPDARETLKAALRQESGKKADKITAAGLAGDLLVMDDEMADLLMGIVSDSAASDELRAMAAISLGPALEDAEIQGYDDEDPLANPAVSEGKFQQICETLQLLYADESLPKEVRRRVLEASIRSPQEWHQEAVAAAAVSEDEEWKLTAAFAMRWIPGFEDEILEMLESSNPEIYYEAIQAAGNQEVEGAWPHIISVLESPDVDKTLLIAAIEAAPYVNREEAKAALADLLDHEDEEIADAAMEAMEVTNFDPDAPDDDEFADDFDGDEDEDEDEDDLDEEGGDGGKDSENGRRG